MTAMSYCRNVLDRAGSALFSLRNLTMPFLFPVINIVAPLKRSEAVELSASEKHKFNLKVSLSRRNHSNFGSFNMGFERINIKKKL